MHSSDARGDDGEGAAVVSQEGSSRAAETDASPLARCSDVLLEEEEGATSLVNAPWNRTTFGWSDASFSTSASATTRRASSSVMDIGSHGRSIARPDAMADPWVSRGNSLTTYRFPVVRCFAKRTVPCVPRPTTLPKTRSDASVSTEGGARGLADAFFSEEDTLLRSTRLPRGRFPGAESRGEVPPIVRASRCAASEETMPASRKNAFFALTFFFQVTGAGRVSRFQAK